MFFFKPKRRKDTGVVNLPDDPSGINPFISQVNKVKQPSTNTGWLQLLGGHVKGRARRKDSAVCQI